MSNEVDYTKIGLNAKIDDILKRLETIEKMLTALTRIVSNVH